MSSAATRAPSAAYARTVAAPMPFAAPVTMIRLPASCIGPSEIALAADAAVGADVVEQGGAGRDLQLEDLGVAEPVEVHHEGPERVAMGDDEHVLPRLQIGKDVRLPVRQHPLRGVGQALAPGRSDVVAAAPELDLGVAELLRRLGLVETLEVAVHALVEGRILLGGQCAEAGRLEGQGGGVDRALQDGGVELVDAVAAQLLARGARLVLALGRERHVDPAREAVLEVPLGLAVPQ